MVGPVLMSFLALGNMALGGVPHQAEEADWVRVPLLAGQTRELVDMATGRPWWTTIGGQPRGSTPISSIKWPAGVDQVIAMERTDTVLVHGTVAGAEAAKRQINSLVHAPMDAHVVVKMSTIGRSGSTTSSRDITVDQTVGSNHVINVKGAAAANSAMPVFPEGTSLTVVPHLNKDGSWACVFELSYADSKGLYRNVTRQISGIRSGETGHTRLTLGDRRLNANAVDLTYTITGQTPAAVKSDP